MNRIAQSLSICGGHISPWPSTLRIGIQRSCLIHLGLTPNALSRVQEQWKCIFANFSYAHTKSPIFPMNSVRSNLSSLCALYIECCSCLPMPASFVASTVLRLKASSCASEFRPAHRRSMPGRWATSGKAMQLVHAAASKIAPHQRCRP